MKDSTDRTGLGFVPLLLVDASKSMEMAPNGITAGSVVLRGWRIHRLAPPDHEFDGHAVYLVRVNYEIDFDPDAPPPDWVEVMFRFPAPEHIVIDAVPLRVTQPLPTATYALTEQLQFVQRDEQQTRCWPPGSPAASIVLPPVQPPVECVTGPGGTDVCWRHWTPAQRATHAACFVLVAPESADRLPVVAMVRYAMTTEAGLRLRPSAPPEAFTVTLPRLPTRSGGRSPALSTNPALGRKRVFVSYAWENDEHIAAVDQLWKLLDQHEFDVRIDRAVTSRHNWELWSNVELTRADFILVIASPAYRAAALGELADDEHPGIQAEYGRIADLHHGKRSVYTKKILPVVLPGRSVDEIPLSFLPETGSRFVLPSLSSDGIAALVAAMSR